MPPEIIINLLKVQNNGYDLSYDLSIALLNEIEVNRLKKPKEFVPKSASTRQNPKDYDNNVPRELKQHHHESGSRSTSSTTPPNSIKLSTSPSINLTLSQSNNSQYSNMSNLQLSGSNKPDHNEQNLPKLNLSRGKNKPNDQEALEKKKVGKMHNIFDNMQITISQISNKNGSLNLKM